MWEGLARCSGPASDFRSRTSYLGINNMSPIYIARTKEVAARMLGGEMMIMSALDSTEPCEERA